MKQVLQDLGNGRTYVAEVPAPAANSGALVIATHISLISAGTERMLVEFGNASLLKKAMKQPERVRDIIDKIGTDGLGATVSAVRSKLAQPIPLGYCNVGRVVEVGAGVNGFKIGARVVSNGPHAEVVRVPKNLCALIPDKVDDETAAFAVIAAIGLQGVRLAQPTLGESFVVIGAGLIGLMTIQILLANGCRVLAVDLDPKKLSIAASYGAETCNPSQGADVVSSAISFSRSSGVDGVIIAASTPSSDPVSQAARMCRKRGRIILVGVTGLELKRAEFYEKEISFQVSCSYGPGRYDPLYEQHGQDYPAGFVRWTEQRNFEAVLDLMATGRLSVKGLVGQRFAIEDASKAYAALSGKGAALGLLLTYASPDKQRLSRKVILSQAPEHAKGKAVIGVIGAGNYASRMLLPAFKAAGAQFSLLAASSGLGAAIHGEKVGFTVATSESAAVFGDAQTSAVIIATRHDSHAMLTAQALRAGKHVFVEKPLAIDRSGLSLVRQAFDAASGSAGAPQMMVGFNRRFAPNTVKLRQLLSGVAGPKSLVLTMNAGAIPANHWTQLASEGGGRIIGEACHHIDLARFLVGAPIAKVHAVALSQNQVGTPTDTATITLQFADGSIATVHYFANGSAQFPKERVEVFAQGRVLQLDNFQKLIGYGWPGFSSQRLWTQDKGQSACAAAFLSAVETGVAAIPVDEIFEVAEITLEAARLLEQA